MKHVKFLPGLLTALFFTCAFLGCKKELKELTPETSFLPSNLVVNPSCCVTAYSTTTLYSCNGLVITAQNNASTITVNINYSAGNFTRVLYSIYKTGTTDPGTTANNSSGRSSFTVSHTFAQNWQSCDEYNIYLEVKGLGQLNCPEIQGGNFSKLLSVKLQSLIPIVAPITADASNVCIGSTLQLTNATAGGSWSSSNNAIATVSASGLVSGVSAGTVTISYVSSNAQGCSGEATKEITVEACSFGCTYTQGYWKNHGPNPSGNNTNVWPVNNLTLGTVNYSAAQLQAIFEANVGGNGIISLAHQLIAAKLNIANGASAPTAVVSGIASADALIGNLVIPPGGSGHLATSATSALNTLLDNYNNGITGPGHCN